MIRLAALEKLENIIFRVGNKIKFNQKRDSYTLIATVLQTFHIVNLPDWHKILILAMLLIDSAYTNL